jgi:hypothetical protein
MNFNFKLLNDFNQYFYRKKLAISDHQIEEHLEILNYYFQEHLELSIVFFEFIKFCFDYFN